jgi:hypothetical protein
LRLFIICVWWLNNNLLMSSRWARHGSKKITCNLLVTWTSPNPGYVHTLNKRQSRRWIATYVEEAIHGVEKERWNYRIEDEITNSNRFTVEWPLLFCGPK